MPSNNVIAKGAEIYLRIDRNWYVYNSDSAPLGSGAMGTVFLGHSCSHPQQRVAIKLVATQYQDIPSIRERALVEGNLKFGHPHLIQMVGCCEYDNVKHKGPIWIISHLVQGISLDQHADSLRTSKNPLRNIIETMYPVLDALDYLHGGDIYHLDIKPSNIMVENGCNIRLLDLGIASVGSVEAGQGAGLLGTPQYAAPEQFFDDNKEGHEEINGTTDIYQVGVTLYELLTQSNPYQAPTIHQAMVRHKELWLPESKLVPKPILEVLRKATSPRQADRYQSAMDFQSALKLALKKHETAPTIPHWIWALIGISAILILTLILILIGS